MSFALDANTPKELRVDMFVRKSGEKDGKPFYDIGWAEEYTGDDSCNFKSLAVIAKETGVDFSLMGLKADLNALHALPAISQNEVILWHSISRFWAIKNSLINSMKNMRAEIKSGATRAQTEDEMQEKIQKLQEMTYKVLKQNAAINKRLKYRQQQIEQEQSKKSFFKKLFG